MEPIITEEYWRNSQLSIAAHYGGIVIEDRLYQIVNKNGICVFELCDPASEHYVGDKETKAIPAGEPCDLVDVKWIPLYRKLGRERLFELLKQNKTFEEIETITEEK